jgi:hypothetical protein
MTFTTLHIGGTALLTGVLACAVALQQLGRAKLFDAVAVGVLSAAAVFMWRLSANMPQLNTDGLRSFSANDWAAPILVYLVLCGYIDIRRSADSDRFRRTRAVVGLVALAVNVITI